jgi:serine/threonine-protein kinase
MMTGSTTRVGSSFGPYQIRALLGRGGMGEVYEAYDTVKGRVVALKVLAEQHCGDETFRERFRRESHAAAKLQEPHVIPIHDWGDVDGTLYIDMRRIDGVDLRTLLENGPLDPPRAVAITSQVAAALDAAHSAGLIHRDVKPENIIVSPADFAYLVDFGIAEAAGETRLTAAGTAVGSFAYMAPERFGTDGITPAADIYSLACVLYETLVGSSPYPSTSLQQVIAAHTSAPPPQPSAVNPAVPASFDEVIARGMAKEPDDRYGSAAALGRAAQRALRAANFDGTQVASATVPPTAYAAAFPRPPSVLQRQAGPGEKRRSWVLPAVIAAAAAVTVAAFGVTVLVATRHDSVVPRGVANPPTPTVTAGVTVSPPSRQPTTEPVSPPPIPAAALPPNARVCPTRLHSSGDYTRSAAGTSVTSCAFAESVRVAYGQSGPPSPVERVINAHSPVTGKWYAMTCVANETLVTCSGGNDAVVYAY